MKKALIIMSSTFLLSGTLLFGMVYLAIANYAPQMNGWSDPPGKFSMAMDATMVRVPFTLSIIFMIIGSLLFATVMIDAISAEKIKMNPESKNIEVSEIVKED
ncbi:hypothetical protein [Bacillus sp. FJAT-26390]|uniref:hypothetical protein n=1 Tax=Bacillus sp. FJAT-26390 TaxID=1743142 RepID=UPI000807AD04|nr:hypothetical protein [Bacillus sp. FJAT-26390]OBZ16491.1 hypothetical protein A7975_00750 [Bacillus sp. FJAT-26390]